MPDWSTRTGVIERVVDGVVRALGGAGAWLFAAAMAITVYEVVSRYLFDRPTTWAHVSATALCAVAFALGGAYAQARSEHMRVTSLTERLSAGARRACELLAAACGAIYLAGLGWGTWVETRSAVWRFEFDINNVERWVPEPLPGPPGWPLPAIIKAMLFAGAVLFVLVVLTQAVRHLRRQS